MASLNPPVKSSFLRPIRMGFPMGFPWVFHGFSMGFPLVFLAKNFGVWSPGDCAFVGIYGDQVWRWKPRCPDGFFGVDSLGTIGKP